MISLKATGMENREGIFMRMVKRKQNRISGRKALAADDKPDDISFAY